MKLRSTESELQSDVANILQIPIVSTLLDVICRTTGMGFAAIARVTDDRWITCTTHDDINFGLAPGDELKVETTICHEIRQSGNAVIIDNVDENAAFCNHATPAMYGFKSYISMPIYRKDGSFFGTLCAIDPKPAKLNNPAVIGMFHLFADLISFHLSAAEELRISELNLLNEREERTKLLEAKNHELQKMNEELESFAYVASHDLQEPLRKIATYSGLILHNDDTRLSGKSRNYFDRLNLSVKRMQTLINDLIMFTQLKDKQHLFEIVSFNALVEKVKENFEEDIQEKAFVIQSGELVDAYLIPYQFKQLLHNLISNAIKFSRPGLQSVIQITSAVETRDEISANTLLTEQFYFHLTISDNGIGFDQKYSEQIFNVFQRLNGREEFEGTGIGLAIVKKIVANHNGFITATGDINNGARFDIYIPQPAEIYMPINIGQNNIGVDQQQLSGAAIF